MGLYLGGYINPMIAESYHELYEEALKNDYFVKKSKKKEAKFNFRCKDQKECTVSILDFTNPEAVNFY